MDDLKIEILNPNSEDAGILRTSTQRQQDNGDPLPIQKEKIEYSAAKNNQTIGAWIEFAMPASGKFDTQPLLKALTYLETIPTLKRVWVSIVNRATRGELYDFLMVQRAYSKKGLQLLDSQGELLEETKDTLESFGVNYKFNQYNGNEQKIVNAVIAARTNWRENLTQLHSAEIKYARLGYFVSSRLPEGFKKVRVQNEHGKRWTIEPDESKSLWFHKMFELSLKKAPLSAIVAEVNQLGYRTEKGTKLTKKQLDKFLQNPIYALVRNSKSQQVGGKPIKMRGVGYLTIEQFNEINQGRLNVMETADGLKILKGKLPVTKAKENPLYPYKQFILCPMCRSNLWGSAPKGRHGGVFPQYHCQKGHKYWHVSTKEMEQTILEFTKSLKLSDDRLLVYKEALLGKVRDKLATINDVAIDYNQRLSELEFKSNLLLSKIRNSTLLIVQQDLENELKIVEEEKVGIRAERDRVEAKQIDLSMVIDRVVYFLEHLEKGLLGIANPTIRAAAWSTIFEETPTYEDLKSGTPALRPHIKLISRSENDKSLVVDNQPLNSNPFESILQQYLALQKLGVLPGVFVPSN